MRARADRGSVSVELAAALPAVVLVLGLVLAAVAWARDSVVAADAAAMGARVAAVEGAVAAHDLLAEAVPGADVTIDESEGRVVVHVSVRSTGWLPVASASATGLST